MKEHQCKVINYCICNTMAAEPDEDCSVHGHGPIYPRRCTYCGRYMKKRMFLNKGVLREGA